MKLEPIRMYEEVPFISRAPIPKRKGAIRTKREMEYINNVRKALLEYRDAGRVEYHGGGDSIVERMDNDDWVRLTKMMREMKSAVANFKRRVGYKAAISPKKVAASSKYFDVREFANSARE